MIDLIIRNASVIDGTGRSSYATDVAVTGGKIADVGPIPLEAEAKETLNAQGLTLSPGFIDIHTHADIALLARPEHLPKIMQGVTTEVFTNCGLGFAPCTPEALGIQREYLLGLFGDDSEVDWAWSSVAEFLAGYEKRGIATNVAYLIPHGAVRVSVMGMAARPADSVERERMASLVKQGIDEGAWGLSTGLWYAPMSHADHAENVAVCRAAGFFATHQRSYAEDILEATEESLQIARDARVPIQISHLQMNGPANAGRAPELLGLLDKARSEGVDVTCDTYPYTAGSTFIQSLLPTWATDGGPQAIMRRLAEPETCSRIEAALESRNLDWSSYTLVGAESALTKPYEGLSFHDIADRRKLDPCELVIRLLVDDELRVCYVHHGAHEENVKDILQWPDQMVASDGLHLRGKTHPRLYGTFPRVLGHYARDERVIPLESAVYKMTGQPAQRLGLKDRGVIRPGAAADLVLFDPLTIRDTATFEDPLRFPEGIPHVFVNGVAVKKDGHPTRALPGVVLRRR